MKKLQRGYYYLFYKFYKMSEAAPSRWLSEWKAGLIIVVLEIWLLYSLANYYNIFVDKHFDFSNITAIIAVLIICLFNYFLFFHSDKWKGYAEEFNHLPRKKNKLGSWFVFGIVVFVLANLIFSFYLMSGIDWSQYR